MGGGRWTDEDWSRYSSSHTKGKRTEEIYTSRGLHPDLDPKGVTRESCDSEDNPNSRAIIVALDVTGSMDPVLKAMAQEGCNALATEIYERKPVTDPHIMFMGVGDVDAGDRAPIQVTQFEADIRIAESLAKIWLEKCGGGNSYESYHLPWYFAGMHTVLDCFNKRGKKGYLFTVGDEKPPIRLLKKQALDLFGDEIEADIPVEDLIALVSRQYEIFHLVVEEGMNYRSIGRDVVYDSWTKLLGQRVLPLVDHTKLSEVVVSAIQINEGATEEEVIASWDGSTAMAVKSAVNGMTSAKSGDESGIVTL